MANRYNRSLIKTAPPTGRKGQGFARILAALILFGIAAGLIYLAPGLFRASWGGGTILVVGNEKAGEIAVRLTDGELFIDLEALRLHLDPQLFWDEAEQTAVITTAGKVIHIYLDRLAAEVNLRPTALTSPAHIDGGIFYLPLLFLADYYDLTVNYHPETNTVVVDRIGEPGIQARITSRGARLRKGPGLHCPYLALLEEGETVRLQNSPQDTDKWALVRTSLGLTGYLPRRSLQLPGPEPAPEEPPRKDQYPPKKIPPAPLVMTWEYAYSRVNVDAIPEMPSLHIVAPTWFHLLDNAGNMKNLADPAYIDWAKERGYLVWALVSNSFDGEITAAVLSSTALRRKVIDELITYARIYKLDGLNLDFENFSHTYSPYFTQFVRELAPLCAQEGLVLSAAVGMAPEGPARAGVYDYGALAEAADYLALMAYDEHWENCPLSGPVASLPWVERGIQKALEEIPPDKLLLGVPFYTRLWRLASAGGDAGLSSRSYSMGRIAEILSGREVHFTWDEKAGQNMGEYCDGENFYRLWLEDGNSIARRLELVNRYRLAGVASWRRGLEKPEIWELIGTVLSGYETPPQQ